VCENKKRRPPQADAFLLVGFSDIAMATGHSPEKFSHLPCLKVTGKDTLWA
jgi:hypothetical protein